MCLIMTLCVALVLTIVYARKKKSGLVSKSLLCSVLMFWSAALMWAVDGIAALKEGEPFFDFSIAEVRLGIIIVASGMFILALLSFLERRKSAVV